MGIWDKPFGVQVGPFGASGTASELASSLQNEARRGQLEQLMKLYKLNHWIGQGVEGLKQVPGEAYQALPSFKVETPVGSFEKPSGSSLFGAGQGTPPEKPDQGFQPRSSSAVPLGGGAIGKMPLPQRPERPSSALGQNQQSDYARLLDKFATQGRVSSAGPGMYKIMGPNGTPTYVTENQLYENLKALDAPWDQKLAGAKDQSLQTLPINNRPGLSDLGKSIMPMGSGPGQVPYPDQGGVQTGTPKPQTEEGGQPGWMKVLQMAGPLAGHISRSMSAPGNERPFAQMGYLKETARQDELAQQKELEAMRTESAWARGQAEIEAELERQRMANEAAMERQKAEQQAAWERQQADIEARKALEKEKYNDITITPEMAEKLGGPWAAMVGQTFPASVLGQSIGYQATQQGYLDRQDKQQKYGEYQALQKALMDPQVKYTLSPEELQFAQQRMQILERELFPDMVSQVEQPGPMATPPPAAQPQADQGPGLLDKGIQAGKNLWNYFTSRGETDPNAPVAQGAPNPFEGLPVSQSTKQALLGIQSKHGNDPIALKQALTQLAQSVSPQEKEAVLKLIAQFQR